MITPHPPPPSPGRNMSLYAYHWSLSFNLSKIYTLHPLQCSAVELTAHLGVLTIHSAVFYRCLGFVLSVWKRCTERPETSSMDLTRLKTNCHTNSRQFLFSSSLFCAWSKGHSYVLQNPSKMCLHSGSQSIFGNTVQVAEILLCPSFTGMSTALPSTSKGSHSQLCSGLIILWHVSVLCCMVKRSASLLPFLYWREAEIDGQRYMHSFCHWRKGIATQVLCYNFKDEIPTRNSIRQKLRRCYLSFVLSRADGDIELIIINNNSVILKFTEGEMAQHLLVRRPVEYQDKMWWLQKFTA